ncbi:MAG: hypothetical protein KGH59_04190 [Candidatus Micrarchaeota archaeon]|nr:hypothetical protein [Candidatus Micrarchaeota archaeon]MDE1804952.1 hypothetical protein [Candidatus Micrarchaeota archaeon]MDE1846815.1 hypothetical protein [Candidatus Micrarchaeota archaeon]
MTLEVFRSPDGRYRTQIYSAEGLGRFAVAEKTMHGVLVTEFSERGEVLDQVHKKSGEPIREIVGFVSRIDKDVAIKEIGAYEGVSVDVTCEGCSKRSLRREMEMTDTRNVANVPVVPMFVCTNCRKRYYSMTQSYIRKLVARNMELFEDGERKMRESNEAAFLKEIQEYMVRIFASKKIALIKISE